MKVFGEFEFDERSLQLRRGGSTVSINGQCLDLLVMMLERAGAANYARTDQTGPLA